MRCSCDNALNLGPLLERFSGALSDHDDLAAGGTAVQQPMPMLNTKVIGIKVVADVAVEPKRRKVSYLLIAELQKRPAP
jgi:hypothetical protein